jgi:hypothetical protein
VMGILNVTPDSFYDGGKYTSELKIMERVDEIVEQGAGIIDVGELVQVRVTECTPATLIGEAIKN